MALSCAKSYARLEHRVKLSNLTAHYVKIDPPEIEVETMWKDDEKNSYNTTCVFKVDTTGPESGWKLEHLLEKSSSMKLTL